MEEVNPYSYAPRWEPRNPIHLQLFAPPGITKSRQRYRGEELPILSVAQGIIDVHGNSQRMKAKTDARAGGDVRWMKYLFLIHLATCKLPPIASKQP